MKILALGASTSSTSINRRFANHAANQIKGAEVTELDLRSYDLPIFSTDLEKEEGPPSDAQLFLDKIKEHDGIVISLAEHNGSYSAAFKNLYDWVSRIEQKVWSDKPLLLLATSPGGRGAASVLASAGATFPHMGARIVASFSLPSFNDNFSDEDGVTDEDMRATLGDAIAAFAEAVK